MLSIAFKAQEQSRKTLETLADIRNPRKPSQFIKQYVDKQLNSLRIDQNEQLEGTEDEPIDFDIHRDTEEDDSRLEAVDAIDRRENSNGQGDLQSKRD